ncbi:MAG: hypothetical protein KDD35_12530, partial [Bdellovibrionales bacterium]|nr:hypothetical protein [Bdellovibrionales bacterium]
MVFAAIDTGSNAIRMALSKCLLGQLPEDIEVIRVPVRLGKDVFAHGYVKEKTAKELFSAFQQFRRIMDKQGVEHYRAVATSALREAQNGKELAQEIHRLTNINLEIIDGLAEAELVLLAISDYFKIAQLDALILDIGGGSVEAIICWQGKVQSLESLRMGTVRLLKDFDPDHELDSMLSRVRQNVRRFHHKLSLQRNQHSERLIVTGGNARCLGRLAVQ